jgi:hypothetical protein
MPNLEKLFETYGLDERASTRTMQYHVFENLMRDSLLLPKENG